MIHISTGTFLLVTTLAFIAGVTGSTVEGPGGLTGAAAIPTVIALIVFL
jgi:hypothetical protein